MNFGSVTDKELTVCGRPEQRLITIRKQFSVSLLREFVLLTTVDYCCYSINFNL